MVVAANYAGGGGGAAAEGGGAEGDGDGGDVGIGGGESTITSLLIVCDRTGQQTLTLRH